tara:strand:- start:211 stop:810 length:600 start_codon:yes stop_codon:yes gene_type:complete
MEADGGTSLAECPQCLEVVEHAIIKRNKRGSGEDVLAKCEECHAVHTIIIRPPKATSVNTTLSDGEKSFNEEIEVDQDELISVGDMFEHNGMTWKITRIDNSQSRPQENLPATEIYSMWATRNDRTILGVTMTDGEVSESGKIECEPDRIFTCGSIIKFADSKWRIRAIHTGKGRTLNGSRMANEIRRIYLHPQASAKK